MRRRPAHHLRPALEAHGRVLSFDTLSETVAALPDAIRPGDRVLVKASHSMQFEKIVSALHALYRENA